MKILKIFGIVVGIHVFALVLIFANPGCSSSTKPAPSPGDTVAASAPTSPATSTPPASTPPPLFNPDAPATAAPTGSGSSGGATVRFTPTRPGTPVASAIVSEPVADVQPATTYTVKSGDSLWTIAKKHHLTVAQLTAANNLPTNAVLKANQKLVIPKAPGAATTAAAPVASAPAPAKSPEAAAPAPKASSASAAGAVKHTVKSGETLGAIARTYGVKSGDIAVANNISDPAKIRAGMELIIPGWEAPTKSGKSGSAKSTPPPAQSQPAPTTPSAPPTINFDTPPSMAPTQSQQPLVPVIGIDDNSAARPAPKAP